MTGLKLICFVRTDKKEIYVNPEYIVSVDECDADGICEVNTVNGRFYVGGNAGDIAKDILREIVVWQP